VRQYRLLDCQREHCKPPDPLDGRVDEHGDYHPGIYRPPIGAYLAGAIVWTGFLALVWSFYRVGRWYGWWP
jgi:hypothetical protein